MISSWAVYANGQAWDLLNGGVITHYPSRIYLTNRRILATDDAIPPRTLGLIVSRSISGGMHEDLDLTKELRAAGRTMALPADAMSRA